MSTTTFKETCLTLRKKGYTLDEIAAVTQRPRTSVYFHIKNISLSTNRHREWIKTSTERLVAINQSRKGKSAYGRHPIPFTHWTPNLVMLVAHFLFDGEIKHAGCVYTNRSEALLHRVEELMLSVYPYEPKKIVSSPNVYRISYHNVELGAYIKEKSVELLQIISALSPAHKKAFLQAFFDDEGSVYFINNKRMVRGYQHSVSILNLIQKLLEQLHIESRINSTCCEITISKKENLERFQKEINFSRDVYVNGSRSNSVWKKSLEKREILRRALASYKN